VLKFGPAWAQSAFFDRCSECATAARPMITHLFKAARRCGDTVDAYHIRVSLYSHYPCHGRSPPRGVAFGSVGLYALSREMRP
jgi:hypothetical protein